MKPDVDLAAWVKGKMDQQNKSVVDIFNYVP